MKNSLKIINFEWNRFIKLYSILFGLVFVFQMIGLVIAVFSYTASIRLEVGKNNMSTESFIDMYGTFGLENLGYSLWFLAPIAISIAALLFYVPFVWYRDWFARNTFIYRLFMLPTSRMNLFFAKLATIMVGVLSMVAYQLLLLTIYKEVIKWIVPSTYRNDQGIVGTVMESSYLSVMLPSGVMEFIVAYGLGISLVIVIFTAILMERSFRLLGIVMGAVYVPAMVFIFFIPSIVVDLYFNGFPLYRSELFIINVVMWLLITVGSLWISSYLLKRKVTV